MDIKIVLQKLEDLVRCIVYEKVVLKLCSYHLNRLKDVTGTLESISFMALSYPQED